MKKLKILATITIITICITSQAQIDDKIVSYFQNAININPENFLFTPSEVIVLCNDSVGRKKFEKTINWVKNVIQTASIDEAKERKVLLSLISNKINATQVTDPGSIESKLFIQKLLSSVTIDFEVNEELLMKRFNTKNDVSYCSRCISMYIFFIYNPELYVKVRSQKKDFVSSNIHFPLTYILQDCNTTIEITKKIQRGLLELIKDNNNAVIKKIYTEIDGCDLTNRCN